MVSLLCLAAGISFDMYIFSTIILYFFSMIWLLNNFTFSIFILLDKRICTTGPRIVANSNSGNVLFLFLHFLSTFL